MGQQAYRQGHLSCPCILLRGKGAVTFAAGNNHGAHGPSVQEQRKIHLVLQLHFVRNVQRVHGLSGRPSLLRHQRLHHTRHTFLRFLGQKACRGPGLHVHGPVCAVGQKARKDARCRFCIAQSARSPSLQGDGCQCAWPVLLIDEACRGPGTDMQRSS